MELTALATPLLGLVAEGDALPLELEPPAGAVALALALALGLNNVAPDAITGAAVANAPAPERPFCPCPTVEAADADAWKVWKLLFAS